MDTTALAARQIARLVNENVLSREEVVRDHLAVIQSREPSIHAFAFLDPDKLVADAREADRHGRPGALAGVPFGIKDVIDTAEMPTEYGSRAYRGHRPKADAALVSLARRQGGMLAGKTATTEFAMAAPAATRNPRNPEHTPGGSSSGSAAAVAAGMLPLAVGTQTAGSLIRPAAFCGVVGYKPSLGLIDRTGIKSLVQSLDTAGIMARDVEDAALFASVLSRRPTLACGPADWSPRIGMLQLASLTDVEPATLEVLDRGAKSMERAGAAVGKIIPPEWVARLGGWHDIFMGFEISAALGHELSVMREQLRAETLDYMDRKSAITVDDYEAARRSLAIARLQLEDLFGGCDVLVVPSAPGEAPAGLASTGSAILNSLWTLLGLPCLTLPAGLGPRGLPIGIQLIARPDDDLRLLQVALRVQAALAG